MSTTPNGRCGCRLSPGEGQFETEIVRDHFRYPSPMLSERFERLFRRLLIAFVRYDNTARSPDNVKALGTARIDLENLRRQIASERDVVLGLGRSRTREDYWRTEEAIARNGLFTLANTSN